MTTENKFRIDPTEVATLAREAVQRAKADMAKLPEGCGVLKNEIQ